MTQKQRKKIMNRNLQTGISTMFVAFIALTVNFFYLLFTLDKIEYMSTFFFVVTIASILTVALSAYLVFQSLLHLRVYVRSHPKKKKKKKK